MKIADCAIAVHMSVTKAALISSLRSSVFIEPVLYQDRKIVPRAVVESDPGAQRRRDGPVEREVGDRLWEPVLGLAVIS